MAHPGSTHIHRGSTLAGWCRRHAGNVSLQVRGTLVHRLSYKGPAEAEILKIHVVYPCLSMFIPDLLCAFQFFKGIQQALDISVHRCHQVTTFNHTGEDVYCFSSPNTQPFADSVCWVCGESNSSWVHLAHGFT